jgi:beta-N-acetylhexosaminidase
MGDRCASTDPAEVAAAVGAFLHGLEAMGVRGCLKHFPGLGGTLLDSHQGLPELDDPGRIAANARAFQMLAHEDRLVMVAHLKTPATGGLPASLHRGSVAENPWGATGRFLPDDLEMGGCADWSWTDRVRLSLEAGHEWLLVCQSEQGIRACLDAAETLPETLWQPAVARNQAMRANLPAVRPGQLDQAAWTDWAKRVRQASLKAEG